MKKLKKSDRPGGLGVVGIGASAGGVKALKDFFANVEPGHGLAYVVIVHLSENHESMLAEILQTGTKMPVSQVTETVTVEPDHVYVIPPTKHLEMVDGIIRLAERTQTHGRRVPIDLFFRTLGEAYGKHAYAVVLSGAGNDGTMGIERVKEEGGLAFAQEPADAEYDSMPRSAIATELVDVVLPAALIPAKILAMRRLEEELAEQEAVVTARDHESDLEAADLREVLTLVRLRTGHDFSNYKRPTLLRRIGRRLQVNELTHTSAYLKLLKEKPEEVQRLLRDLLITVTNFFRDKESFQYLEQEVIPKLFEGKTSADMVRVWSCGCGTGEEPYSLGMLLHEYAATLPDPPRIQIFGSDINEEAIRAAREGSYAVSITADITPERLNRFFVRRGNSYQIVKELRESVLFAPHNVLRDPPFSQLDLVSCRNLLIYLNRDMQDRVMDLFNFALHAGSYLFLGSSEAAENRESTFHVTDKKHRVYKNLDGSKRRAASLAPVLGQWEVRFPPAKLERVEPGFSFAGLHHRVAELYAPPSILVNDEYDLVHMSDRAGRFMRFAGGEPSKSLLKTIHPALRLDLRAALTAAAQENRQAEFRNIRLVLDGADVLVNVIVRPVELPDSPRRFFLVVFDDERKPVHEEGTHAVFEALGGDSALESVVRRLEEELQQAKERLRLTIEHGEVSTEELKASNEELQAINEELRSATEELETSKEELQSVNEELLTVNNELKEKVMEIGRVNSDLQNLMHSTDIGTIFLDRGLLIKRYTRRVEQLFNVIASDLGRPFEHLTHKFDYAGLPQDCATVLSTLTTLEREVRVGSTGGCFLARISPYRTLEDRIDGVVISFVEITELRRLTDRLQEHEFLLRMAQEGAKAGVWTVDLDDGTAWWSDECSRLYQQEPGTVAMTAENWIVAMHPHEEGAIREAIEQAVATHSKYAYEMKLGSAEGERWILEVGRAFYGHSGTAKRLAGISLDVTERVALQHEQSELLARRSEDEQSLRDAAQRKDEFLATLAHELRNPLAPIRTGVELLNRTVGGDPKVSRILGVMERQTTQIVGLIDDLLDVSRITRGKIRLKKSHIDLRDVVRDSIDATRPALDEGGQHLEVKTPEQALEITGDPQRLAQVISNIVGNAAKYSPADSTIRLVLREEDDEAVITVADEGIGIAPAMMDGIFEMFVQVSDQERGTKGLGIGLTLVRLLLEKHGGTVSVRSEGLGHGCEFEVRLPKHAPTGDEDMAEETIYPRLLTAGPKSILVVDDRSASADLLAMLLKEEGFTVRTAYDGHEALAVADEMRPDLIFLDIGLPGMDGNEVAKRIRAEPWGRSIALVALTGWGQMTDREKTKASGFDFHLVKPVDPKALERLLQR